MASDDFNESKYTEAAWSAISSLMKVADYYQVSTVEAPLLLDVMLNPSKHNAGDDAEAAKRVVEKVLVKAGANMNELRSALDSYLSKQPRISDNAQKQMGRTLSRVLENARTNKNVLNVSERF
jgi:ATP-dependent Clp protease ATP-binding subunit ClpB